MSTRLRLSASLIAICGMLAVFAPPVLARASRVHLAARAAGHRSHASRRRRVAAARRHRERSRAAGRRSRRRARRFQSNAIRVPPQSVFVTARGEAIVFLSCASSAACHGRLTLRIGGGERGLWESGPGSSEWRSLPAAWRRWAIRARRPAVIVHRRVILRQRRVDPVTLRLRRPVLAMLRHSGAAVRLEAVTSWGHGRRRSVAPITLQLEGPRAQVA